MSDETNSSALQVVDPRMEGFAMQLVDTMQKRGVISTRPTIAGITFAELFHRYIETYAKPHLSTWRDMERTFKNYMGQFAGLDLYQITRSEVQAWHAEIGEINGHTIANRALELIAMVYNKAQQWDLIALYNPAIKIKKFKLQSRDRFLQPDEFPRFFVALQSLRYESTRNLILMLLFTGARKSNVCSMRWEQIDEKLRIWRIPKTKNGSPQTVPLTMEAMSILTRQRESNPTPWVFPNRAQNDHRKSFDLAWRELLEEAGIENLRPHDLRRTLASWQAITGANISLIAATLNHKDLSSTAIYARLNTDAVRGAMKDATQAMLEHAGIIGEVEPAKKQPPKPAVSLRKPVDREPWLTEEQISINLRVSKNILARARMQNKGPAYLKEGYNIYYKSSAVLQWWSAYPKRKGGKQRKPVSDD